MLTRVVNDFLTFIGAHNLSGNWYGFWSGFFGDTVIIAAAYGYYRHHNCYEHRCWRAGHPDQDGNVICRHHLAKRRRNQ